MKIISSKSKKASAKFISSPFLVKTLHWRLIDRTAFDFKFVVVFLYFKNSNGSSMDKIRYMNSLLVTYEEQWHLLGGHQLHVQMRYHVCSSLNSHYQILNFNDFWRSKFSDHVEGKIRIPKGTLLQLICIANDSALRHANLLYGKHFISF